MHLQGAAGALGLHDGPGIGGGLAMVWQMLNAEAYNVSTPILQPESFVGEASFRTMLRNASVTTIKTDCQVTAAVTAKGPDGASRIESVSLSCEPHPVTATVFIDASYDGDVMVAAGEPSSPRRSDFVLELSQSAECRSGARAQGISSTLRGARPARSTTRATMVPAPPAGSASAAHEISRL